MMLAKLCSSGTYESAGAKLSKNVHKSLDEFPCCCRMRSSFGAKADLRLGSRTSREERGKRGVDKMLGCCKIVGSLRR